MQTREQRAAWRAANRAKLQRQLREAHLKRMYGLTIAAFEAMLRGQGGGCAICHTTEAGGRTGQFHVDHDHETGRVRGLLCHNCNHGLGHFKDSPELLRAAARYLKR